jgi:hypothetical protein
VPVTLRRTAAFENASDTPFLRVSSNASFQALRQSVAEAPKFGRNAMNITQHTDYALRVLIYAGTNPDRQVTIKETAERSCDNAYAPNEGHDRTGRRRLPG